LGAHAVLVVHLAARLVHTADLSAKRLQTSGSPSLKFFSLATPPSSGWLSRLSIALVATLQFFFERLLT
jgi:hypothetical protein